MNPDEYVRLAEVEDRLWYLRALHARVLGSLEQARVAPGSTVLDAGCGTGGLLRRLQAHRPHDRLRGLDFSAQACAKAAEAGFDVVEGSIEALPFADETFDAIVCADVLSQVESPLLALLEFQRCLRPGGVLVLNTAALPWLWSYHDEAALTVRRFRARELKAMLREAACAVEAFTHWNFFLLPVLVVRRKVFPRRDGQSDVQPPWGPLNAACGAVATFERWLARRGVPLPIGSSIHFVARKPVRAPRVRLQ